MPFFKSATPNDRYYKCIGCKRPDIFWKMHLKDSTLTLSDSLKDLIINMIKVDPKNRLTIDKILEHDWVKNGENLTKESLI